ncbi:hypothetical protein V9K67_13310 [Paraflavisolibacter sp. H34]|uniref:hypothetical protein n=1 Tax=Huijunlia imazamoxiresistens TaxID=3127457 RepID=UPI00301A34B0
MGRAVPFRKGETGSLNIYGEGKVTFFQTEDLGQEDVTFHWEQYKVKRVLMLSEQDALRKRLRKKAGPSSQSNTQPG